MDGHTVLHADDRQGPASRGMPSTQGINAHIAAELAEVTIDRTPKEEIIDRDISRNSPYGMYWTRLNGTLVLKPQGWFIEQVASTANDIFMEMHQLLCKDAEAEQHIAALATSLGEYISERTALNEYAGPRKTKQEADDACYQMCQAAKFFIDATEKARWLLENGQDLESNQQLQSLKGLSQKAAREGYILARAVTAAAPEHVSLDYRPSAKRAVEFSCRKLTGWFAAREIIKSQEAKLKNLAAAIEIANFFKSGAST